MHGSMQNVAPVINQADRGGMLRLACLPRQLERYRFTNTWNSVMRIVRVLGIAPSGLLVIGAVTAYGQINTRAQHGEMTAAVIDDKGNLHVPSDYRTAYQMLGSWAVARDDGPGSSSCTGSMHRPEPSPQIA